LLGGELVGLLLEHLLKCPFGQSVRRGGGDLLHRVEVHVESGSVVAEGTTGDDFAPPGGELAELEEFFWGERTTCHETPCPEVTTKPNRGVAPDDVRTRTSRGKAVHDLPRRVEATPRLTETPGFASAASG
jgi:hypothetical protein